MGIQASFYFLSLNLVQLPQNGSSRCNVLVGLDKLTMKARFFYHREGMLFKSLVTINLSTATAKCNTQGNILINKGNDLGKISEKGVF